MPLFLSDDEFRLIAHDAAAVAERADAFIRDVRRQLDTVRAEADAASIAAEQTCALAEQRYASLYADFSRLQSENAQLSASIELRLSQVADAQAEKHHLHLKAIEKDGEIERLSVEAAESQKAKRQLLELVQQKDQEIQEKNALIQTYLDKIVKLTESNAAKESKVQEIEAELLRCRAAHSTITQEKELLEKHNAWLNEELTAKVNSLVELRRKHLDVEADLSSKLADCERQLSESLNSLNWSKERVRELEMRVKSLEEELCTCKETAAANEERFTTELSTVTKLVELYKASSEEWSKKAAELEGVVKALETHMSQSENDFKEKLETELSAKQELEKDAAELREKLEKSECELESLRKANESSFLPLSSFHVGMSAEKRVIMEASNSVTSESCNMIVPRLPVGISGTALAASLLRDGWSLAKMYEKYQEANDAFLHERSERRNAEMILERVFHEIEQKVEMILSERAEHERMAEAYALMDQKLRDAVLEHNQLENTIRQLKAEVKMRERDYNIAEREINDLQKQVTILLKECQDVQLRCGGAAHVPARNSLSEDLLYPTDLDNVVSDHILTFKDINGLVEQNVHLRKLVHSFTTEEEKRDAEAREAFQIQLQKITDEATAKVEAVLKRSEEQACMIESLHSSVAMYKRLYEEERKNRVSNNISSGALPDDGIKDLVVLSDGSQETKKSHEELSERARNLEQELATLRSELLSLRSQRDKMSLEANFARERLDSFMKEFDRQREEATTVSVRNGELTRLILDYERRLRESSDLLQEHEDKSRQLSVKVSVLEHEKEVLINSENRLSEENRSLTERVYRLQSSLDVIQSTEEVRENARATERVKQEEYYKQIQIEWAEAKRELQEERDRARTLTLDKEKAVENSLGQIEEMRKELADAWRSVASAETRAAIAEGRCSDLEEKINHSEKLKVTRKDGGKDLNVLSSTEVNRVAEDELEKFKEEAKLNKEHMQQYKVIAQTNEIALKQMESAHEEYKLEAEKMKRSLEDEVQSLQKKIHDLESIFKLKSEETALAIESKENALAAATAEISCLRNEIAKKISQIETLELHVSSLKSDVEKEQKRWRTAQDNYERQIILQSETIQELTNTSKELAKLQSEATKWRELYEGEKIQNDCLRKSWEEEKHNLEQLKNEAERKYNEVNEQNKILHNRLEAFHIKLADMENSSGVSSKRTDLQAGNDLQEVVSYLRRSKEIAETEISLLKQEKLRLQSQLEIALKASEDAQALLRLQSENSRTQLYKDEEFKSLQFQVREINLLRESNAQLRAESKHNYEECQKFREEAHKAQSEAGRLRTLLCERELELDACRKEVEALKLEIERLNSRIMELHEISKGVSAEEYERMKDELQHVKVRLGESESEVVLTRNLISEKQDSISSLEHSLAKSQADLAELEKKLSQLEANAKLDIDRHKKSFLILKKKNEAAIAKEREEWQKKIEVIAKEKDEIHFKNQALLKQIEDLKSIRKSIGESSSEQAKKDQEKDTRLQTLEKILERHKEDLKKEKDTSYQKREKLKSMFMELLQRVQEEKTKVEAELEKHREAVIIILEHSGITATQLPPGKNLDEQILLYFQSTGKLEDFASPLLKEVDSIQAMITEAQSLEASSGAATAAPPDSAVPGRQVGSHMARPSVPQAKPNEEREKGAAPSKATAEVKKLSRRLIRPALEQPAEPPAHTETSDPSTSVLEEGKPSASHETENFSGHFPHDTSGQKRQASDIKEEAGTDVAPPLKKSKLVEDLKATFEIPSVPSVSEAQDAVKPFTAPPSDALESQRPAEVMETDEAPGLSNDEIAVEARAEDDMINLSEELEEQRELPIPEDKTTDAADITVEELLSGQLNTETELAGEARKREVEMDSVLQSTVESEDEREEGELMQEELEQEEVSPDEAHNDSLTGGAGEITDDVADATEVASPEIPTEADATEEIGEASDTCGDNSDGQGSARRSNSPKNRDVNNNDQTAPDPVQSSKPAATREVSPAPPAASASQASVSEMRSPSPSPSRSTVATETEAPAAPRTGGRTISLTARARENARLRQQGSTAPAAAPTPIPPRGVRGRAAGGRREGTRGGRGRGGGRGQT